MWHALSEEELIQSLGTNAETGLSTQQVETARAKYGWNELEQSEQSSLLKMILDQFKDLMVIILLVAAAISTLIAIMDKEEGFTGYVEPIVILLILIANAIVGVWQESNAEAALEALQQLQPEHAKVLRDGEWKTINSREVVPGDVLEIIVGDKVPADFRVIKLQTPSLRVDQSSLTGETREIFKYPGKITEEGIVLQDKFNIAFSSSAVTSGSALGIAVLTGMQTELGKIQSEVIDAQKEEEKTPLQEKLEDFGNLLAKIIFIICALVWVMNYKNFSDEIHGSTFNGAIYYFKIAVSLAVAAVPEGLPAVITTCLALGTRRMASRNAIVRKLPSVETLGCTTVICSDKTGTLTTNEMMVTHFVVPGDAPNAFNSYPVSGNGFTPIGDITGFTPQSFDAAVTELVNCGIICNASRLEEQKGRVQSVGMPTESAIKVLCEKIGRSVGRYQGNNPEGFCQQVLQEQKLQRVVTLEFTRERKIMSVLANRGHTPNLLYSKGAPESVLENSTHVILSNGQRVPLTNEAKEIIMEQARRLAGESLRCLALAYKTECGPLSEYDGENHPAHELLKDYNSFGNLEQELVFLGLLGMKDPPRPEVPQSISVCKQAGLRVFMITGDNQLTAEAIARQIGITTDSNFLSLTGTQFAALSEEKATELIKDANACVFSRTEPAHKKRLVQILKHLGEIVAMTGDGVNDAPALQEAQIGVAMGLVGTEVAKKASDMILADDKFSTIVAAIEEGRSIYSNTKAFIRYLISSNIGEVASIFLTAYLGVPEAFTSVQLLWVNLVTDGPPATALGFNPPDLDIMRRPPRKREESLITSWVFFRYMVIGLYVGLATVGIFVYWFVLYKGADGHPLITYSQLSNWSECPGWTDFSLPDWNGINLSANPCLYFSEGKVKASTLSLSVLVTIEMLNALNALSEDSSLVQMPPWVNKWLILAIAGSMMLHCVIVYVPFFNGIFGITSLNAHEWWLVFLFSVPVIFIDEILKVVGRLHTKRRIDAMKKKQ